MTLTRPSLVAMVQADADNSKLAGISLDSVVSTGKRSFHENILFTHRGMSGPAVLQISNYWEKGKPVSIDLMPDIAAAELLYANRDKTQTLANFIGRHLPQRFAESFVEANLPNKPLNKLSDREIRSAGEILNNWRVQFTETEGYGRAEVTLGGISTDELSSQTMESKNVKGLYFIGEVVDVTGWLGGYNFQWAWASGFAAGRSIK